MPRCSRCGEPADHTYPDATDQPVPICGPCAIRMVEAEAPGWELVAKALRPCDEPRLTTHQDIVAAWVMWISGTLRGAGFTPLPSDISRMREGLRVTKGGYVHVDLDSDGDGDARTVANAASEALTEAGFAVDRITEIKMRVTPPPPPIRI